MRLYLSRMKARCALRLHSARVMRADSFKAKRSCIAGEVLCRLKLAIEVKDLFTVENQNDRNEEVRHIFQAFVEIEDFAELQFDFGKDFLQRFHNENCLLTLKDGPLFLRALLVSSSWRPSSPGHMTLLSALKVLGSVHNVLQINISAIENV